MRCAPRLMLVNEKDTNTPFFPEPFETMMYHFVILPFVSSHIAKLLNATLIRVWSSDAVEAFIIRVFCFGSGRGATKEYIHMYIAL